MLNITGEIKRSYIALAEQTAAAAPLITLDADALRRLVGIQTHFPRSIDWESKTTERL